MTTPWPWLIALLWLGLAPASAQAGGMERLEHFVKTTRTGKADFSQVVTTAPKEGQAARTKTSLGVFEFSRPQRFKFVYRKPFDQTIVADGQTLWLYDADLNQVTARKQDSVLASTPAALIASAADLKSLQADFALSGGPDKDGLEWVLAQPRSKDGSLQSVRLGFKGDVLAVLEILDNFGQRSVMTFTAFQTNPVLDAATFQFKPPAGADLIRP